MVPLSIILVSLSIHLAQLSLCVPPDINGHIRLQVLSALQILERSAFIGRKKCR